MFGDVEQKSNNTAHIPLAGIEELGKGGQPMGWLWINFLGHDSNGKGWPPKLG